ncbi:iron ABC transporter permease [Corynebacterium sp. HMSC077D10]|uniref:ABC transporter permease n=2 Tax=unclassified Corynebacterium TaxID=2624378 RepID=UPI00082C6AA6|nr:MULTISPECIES: iron ABC transporter permease [unclassified Corynebacterium]OFL77219.1 iron ABC transporter permease [Corynebacterium sp. HMSC077B05]OFN43488.1 iron ABC transporter permease [Corynebacterium sp. HMSC072G08]OFP16695.1 iron ABC transporter permease [Corynebacterium sp. HMSC065A05]OFP69885.1 iron ABC transporter permease [Corynebacterium sp. HMSC077D10]
MRSSVSLLRGGVWLIVLGLFATPLAFVVSLAMGGNQIPLLFDQGLGQAAWNSLFSTVLSAVGAVVIGTIIAILLDRTDAAGSSVLRLFLLSPLLVPPFIGAIAWMQLFGPAQGFNKIFDHDVWNIYGADGVTFLLMVHSYPTVYVIVSAGLRSIPADLEQAARVAGASTWTVLRTITLPLLRPALLSAFTLTAVANLADFGIPSILGSPARFETLATMIYRFMDSGTVDNPLQVVCTVGVVLLFLGLGAVIADYLVAMWAASKLQDTGTSHRFRLGAARWPVTLVGWVVGLAVTLGPILGLAYRALLPAPGVPFTLDTISLSNFSKALSNPRVIDGFTNSALLALGAALICGVLGWLIGLLVTRTRLFGNTAMTLLVLLPTALPGLIIGVAWLIVGRYTELYNTVWIILLAYVCAFTALVLQAVRAPLQNTPVAVEEAARISGAGPVRALLSTTGAMAIPAAISGAVLVAITAVRELTVSILLISPGTTTLGVQVFNLQQAGNYNQASALSLLFALIGVVGLALTIRPPRLKN